MHPRLLSELQSLQHRYTDENGLAILLTSPGNNIATYLRNTRLLVVGFAMNMDASELSTQYKDLLRSLNPVLPLVIEHLAATSTLTRTETRTVLSKSDQFNRLCELLASKGLEKRPVIFSTIESFRRNLEQHKQTADRCFDETHVRQNHKHVLSNGVRAKGVKRGGGVMTVSKRQFSEPVRSVEMNGCGVGTEMLNKEMEPFVVQFCVFINQLLLSDAAWSGKRSHDASPSPLLPAWLQLDMTRDQVLAFFPSQIRKSIKSSSSSDKFELVSLSSLVSQFKSYVKKYESLAHEMKQLKIKAKLVQSLAERNAHLEDEVWEARKATSSHKAVGSQHTGNKTRHSEREERESVSELKRTLKKSEARVKEVTEINEQWALESQERASEIKVLQIQLQDAKEELQSMKLARTSDQKVQQHELVGRGEEGERRLEEHKLQRERDAVLQESLQLQTELEEERRQREKDRDEIAELRDRADNLKVQAQGKLPTVQEVATLSSDNRQLRDEVEKGRVEIIALMKKLQHLQSKYSAGEIDHDDVSSSDPKTCGAGAKSGILVQGLLNDENTVNRLGDSSTAPIFFDPTPLAPQLTRSNGSAQDAHAAHNLPPKQPSTSSSLSPLPPGQPVADIVSGMKLPSRERECPSCHTVFLMLGEREFQSHIAGCRT